MIREFVNKVINSDVMSRIKEGINNFIGNSAISSVKDKVDGFVNSSETLNTSTSVFDGLNKKVNKFITKKMSGKIKSTKVLSILAKIFSVILALGFGALVVYIMIKLIPTIIMTMATVFAIWISIELILAILDKAVSTKKNAA